MKRLLHLIGLAIISISCVSCEDEMREKAEDIFTVKAPISMTVSIPNLGIENEIFSSEGYPPLVNTYIPHFRESEDSTSFTFKFKRNLESERLKNYIITFRLNMWNVPTPLELNKKYYFNRSSESHDNKIYCNFEIDDRSDNTTNYIYIPDEISPNGWITFTEFIPGNKDGEYIISGEFAFSVIDSKGNGHISNGVFSNMNCS